MKMLFCSPNVALQTFIPKSTPAKTGVGTEPAVQVLPLCSRTLLLAVVPGPRLIRTLPPLTRDPPKKPRIGEASLFLSTRKGRKENGGPGGAYPGKLFDACPLASGSAGAHYLTAQQQGNLGDRACSCAKGWREAPRGHQAVNGNHPHISLRPTVLHALLMSR